MSLEDIKIGDEMLYKSVECEISKIAERNPHIGVPMLKFWWGETSWSQQIDMISDGLEKKIIGEISNQIDNQIKSKNIRNTEIYKAIK